MTDELIDSLLYRSEDTAVDFKAGQYVLSRLDEAKYPALNKSQLADLFKEKKSELLKDVLAMANAWRDGPGYILLGFKERKPYPPEVVGLSDDEYHDDAAFQQFIASHVNGKPSFRYEVRPYRGVTIGIISVAKQLRPPFYAKEQYGKVKAGVVYLRRGSATFEAAPDEIAAMGASDAQTRRGAIVELRLEDAKKDPIAMHPQKVRLLDFGRIDEIEDLASEPGNAFEVRIHEVNADYWRELAEWKRIHAGGIAVHVLLENRSEFALTGCKIELTAVDEDGRSVPLREGRKMPDEPRSSWHPHERLMFNPDRMQTVLQKKTLDVEHRGTSTRCEIRLDRALPGETVAASDFLALLPQTSGAIRVQSRVLATELAAPLIFEVTVAVDATHEKWDMNRLVRSLA